MRTIQLPEAILIVIIINILAGLSAFAEPSYEMSCRNKAKEIAASTYTDCITENRQAQIKEIKAGFKDEMASVKKKYEQKLKSLSGKQVDSPEQIKPQTQTRQTQNLKSVRASGARNLPKKTIKTEVIDLTTPSTDSNQQEEVQVQSQNRLKTDTETPQDVEIVELPTQE